MRVYREFLSKIRRKATQAQLLQQQRLILEITQRIRQSLNLPDILQTTVDEVRQFLHADRVIIFQFFDDWQGIVAVESCGSDWTAILSTKIHDPCFGETYIESFKQGLVTAKSNIQTAGISKCHLELLSSFQVKANLVVPILQDDKLWGLLIAHHCQAPRQWQEAEIDLLKQISAQVSIALKQAELFGQVQTELIERQQAEAMLRLLVQNAPAGIAMFDQDMRYLMASQRWVEEYHLDSVASVINQSHYEVFPEISERWRQIHQRCLAGAIEKSDEDLWLRADGSQQWISWEIRPWHTATGEIGGIIIFSLDITPQKQNEIALQRLNAELEQRVAVRTTELNNLNERLLVAFKEQARTQEALRASEESRQLALELTEIGTWDFHIPSGEAIWSNSKFTLLGLSPHEAEASYKLWRDCVHPDDVDWVEQQLQQAIATQTEYVVEYRVVYPDLSVHWVVSRARATYDESGQPLQMLGVLFDISDLKQAQISLQQQTRQKQLLWNITQKIRQSLDLNVVLNAAVEQVRQTLQVDRAAVYRFGPDWSGDFIVESIDGDWVKLVNPDVRKVWDDTHLQETQGGRFRNQETFVISDIYTAGLHSCHIDLLEQFQAKAYAVVPIFSGEILWGLLAIYQNATTRDWQTWEIELLQQIASQLAIALQQSQLYSQLEAELKERQQAAAVLREAERRWRSLLDNVQLLVVGLDQSGNVNYANPFFLSLTGYTESEVLGKNWVENWLSPADQSSVLVFYSELLSQNAAPYYQNSILTKAGEERFIAWNQTMLQDSNGNVIGTISIGEDITERQKVEQIKNEFIGVVSHELRTPLSAIQMSLGLLQTGIYANKPEKAQRMIEIALMDTKRLVNLVNDILDLERLESGRAVLDKTVCQAADLMRQAVEGMQAIAAQQSISLVIAPTDVTVWAAADTIVQTLTNLLSNAIKFSPPHSVIHLAAARQTDWVKFQVTDQGRGIPADKLETIFGRFQQVDASDSREKGGTGLGLPICRSIIESHGGKIWAESKLGEGSSFFFTLPFPAEVADDR
ncbi:GAF domain-containing protein [Merismopedia glauca]|uniref:histidine kinase n=1 Tax=Merismopedia glauca CCAP 1448/3 TaxID=1296344 RepID=A0A2T1C141_9CYAN|nr:GAF domain-containing protein [Merismopedia glauca]PSB01981.1 hypothetical protein C7B64_15395 [Merismopedia glauca CCAP 1448/3]